MLHKILSQILALLLVCTVTNFAQSKTQTTMHKGKKITWAAKPILLQSDKPQADGKDNQRYVYERLGMLQYDGVDVTPSKDKSTIKEVQKLLQKASKSLKQPKAKGRAMNIKFTNFVVNENGKIVFHEVLLFPFQEDIQLYPNELTPEMKAYIKEVDKIVEGLSVKNKTEKLLFFDTQIEL